MKKIAFYDCEIARCIPDKYSYNDSRYEYCAGWHDKAGMGIACIAVYASWSGYHVFLNDQLEEFRDLISQADEIVGFNSIDFDDQLLATNNIQIKTTYDLLCETRVASGQPPHYVQGVTRGGYSLERLAKANLDKGKTGSGELAPKLWQDGKYREVISYCLNDVALLRELYERRSHLTDPTNGQILLLRGGNKWEWIKAGIKKWLEKILWETSPVRAFLWAIIKSDIRDCEIFFTSPIRFYLSEKELCIKLKLPSLKVVLPEKICRHFEDTTGKKVRRDEIWPDDIPF